MGRQVRRRSTGEVGTAYPVFRDAHVHLGLIDAAPLPLGGIGAVLDLGWSPDIAALAAPVSVTYAGCFLSAPDGYPSDRPWAPRASTVFVATPADAGPAVRQQLDLGAGVIKVTLNRDAGPVLDLATLDAIVSGADGLPVVAHAQGPGMVELALAGGVAALAHAPWTHRLDDAVIAETIEAGQRWISTLDIHGYGAPTPDRARAVDNLARFHAAGGTVVYGTDLGNGPLPVGLNLREIEALREAGLTDPDIIDALTCAWPTPVPTDRVTFVPGEQAGETGAALVGATVVPTNDLEELS
jgi:hypothetical protein